MDRQTNPLLEDSVPPSGHFLDRFRSLSAGSLLVLCASTLLFFSLFVTWQSVEIDFGRAGTATQALDGWDFWGLLIAFASVALVSLVLIVHASDVEISPRVPWELLIFVLALVIVALALVKNMRDANSAWPSYLGIAFAGAAAVGAFLDWSRARARWRTALRHRRRGVKPAA